MGLPPRGADCGLAVAAISHGHPTQAFPPDFPSRHRRAAVVVEGDVPHVRAGHLGSRCFRGALPSLSWSTGRYSPWGGPASRRSHEPSSLAKLGRPWRAASGARAPQVRCGPLGLSRTPGAAALRCTMLTRRSSIGSKVRVLLDSHWALAPIESGAHNRSDVQPMLLYRGR